MIIHWDACIDTASPSATPLATWLLVFDTVTTTSPPLSRSLPLCQPEEFNLDLVLYLSPIPVVHSEVRFPFKRVHQLLTNSLFQSAAQNLLVADEALDVFTIAKSNFPCHEEWIFEEGEQVIVSSEKEGTIAAVESTHLEVDLATNEGIKAVSW